jgi:hypothetical protein
MTIYSRSAAVRPLPLHHVSPKPERLRPHFRLCMYLCTYPAFIGVESPSVGNFNTVSTRARVHHTVRISSYCVIGAGCLVVPTDDELLDEYTVIYGPSAERRVWSGRGKVQEADLRRKHAEYLRETLPKFNRLRRGEAHGHGG